MPDAEKDIVFKATLDDTDVLKAYQRIVKGAEETAGKASNSFDQMNDTLKKTGTGMGQVGKKGKEALEGINKGTAKTIVNLDRLKSSADAIVGALLRVGAQAAKAFTAAVAGGVNLNREAELVKLSLTQIFEGNEKAADAFLNLIDKTAIKIGANRQELRSIAKGILPDVGNIQLTTEILENLIILGRDAGASFASTRIAIEEALSGNLSSLQRRLNVAPATIISAQKYAETLGLAGGLAKALGERVAQTGLSAEVTANSLEVLLNTLKAEFINLQTIMGVAPAAELKEQVQGLLSLFADNREDIDMVAKSFGDVAAKVIELVGSGLQNLIKDLDFDKLEDVGDNITELLDTIGLLGDVLFDPESANLFLDRVNGIVEGLQKAVMAAAQLSAIIKAGAARNKAEREVLGIEGTITDNPAGELVARGAAILSGERGLVQQADIAGEEAFEASLRESLTAFDAYDQRLEENTQKIEERHTAQEESTQADLDAANMLLALRDAEKIAAEAGEEAANAQERISDKRIKLAQDLTRELLSLNRKRIAKEIEDEVKAARKRESIALGNKRKIEDIERKSQLSLDDIKGELGTGEIEAAQEASKRQIDIAKQRADAVIQAEKDLAAELLRIQEQFLLSSEEAERNNDVQSFLAAVRRQAQQVKTAKQGKEEAVQTAEDQAVESTEESKVALQEQLEDLKSANIEKIAEIQKQLARELETQRIADERARDDQKILEEQQLADRQRLFERELAEFKIKEDQKRAALTEALADEFALLEAAQEAKVNLIRLTSDQMIAEARRGIEAIGFSQDRRRQTARERFGNLGGTSFGGAEVDFMAEGGKLVPNRPTVVGEEGPEIIIPSSEGFVIPNTFFRQPTVDGGGGSQTVFNDNRSPTVNMPVGPDIATSPQMRNMVAQVARQVLAEVLR